MQQESASGPGEATTSPVAGAMAAARALVERGLRGDRLRASPCVDGHLVTCGAVGVVSSFSLDSATVRGDSARVVVHYVETGELVPDGDSTRYAPQHDAIAAQPTDTIVLARAPEGWRVVRSDRSTRVSAALAALWFDLSGDDRRRVATDADIGWQERDVPVFTPPAELTQLPREVRDTLAGRGCSVLQVRGDSSRNVVRGAFFARGEDDWAVLCVVQGKGSIQLFRQGAARPVELALVTGEIPNVDSLPNLDAPLPVAYGCAPVIRAADVAALGADRKDGAQLADARAEPFTPAERSAPMHQGIESAGCEGMSNIYYWTGRRWALLSGAD